MKSLSTGRHNYPTSCFSCLSHRRDACATVLTGRVIMAACTKISSIFIDTAPIIYYIEAHPQFGPLTREIVNTFQSGAMNAFTSVITLVEVLPKPIETGQEWLAKRLADFLRHAKGLTLMEVSADIAEMAGKLRGHYPFLRTMDAIQLGAALEAGVDAFLTNDTKYRSP